MRHVWTEAIGGKDVVFDVADIDERPLCPPEDRCVVCDWTAHGGRQPVVGDYVGKNHGKVN